MTNKKKAIIAAVFAVVWLAVGFCVGFFTAKGIYDHPLDESVSRDTVTLHDTVPDYHPVPKDSVRLKYVTRWLPRAVHDTVFAGDYAQNTVEIMHDTVAVQVPITSKHYSGKHYDAYVSGFEVNMDSIFVYNETQLITETITRMKPPNRWELDAMAGVDYNVTTQKYTPFAGGELLYKPSRLQLGIHGGVIKNDKFEPVIGATIRYKVF